MCDKGKEWSQKTIPDGHNMTIVRPTFFGCRLLFTTRNFVFGMNNVVAEYQISSSVGSWKMFNGKSPCTHINQEIDVSMNIVMINDTIMKYENEEKHQIYMETLAEKNHEHRRKYRVHGNRQINPNMLISQKSHGAGFRIRHKSKTKFRS